MKFRLDQLQEEVAAECARIWPNQSVLTEGLACFEEGGEVARAILKRHEGTRGTAEEWSAKLRTEAAQTAFVLLNIASLEGFSLDEAMHEELDNLRNYDPDHHPAGADSDAAMEFIKVERSLLWDRFNEASRRAIRTPDPNDPVHWSMEMENLADRIRQATAVLGISNDWTNIGWTNFPYFGEITGTPLPDEAWDWVQRHVDSEKAKGQSVPSASWALRFRPVKAKS